MKICFIDLDGVMCTRACYGKGMNNKWGAYMFDTKCVSVLNFILQETGAELILSSDWRHHYTLQEMREIFCHNGVIKGPIGFTERSNTYIGNNLENGRSDEIKHWLKVNAWKDDINFVVVDDLNMSEKFDEFGNLISGVKNFVHCPNDQAGIKGHGIKEKIIEILNKPLKN
jgi:hypothetical protein